MATRKDPMNKLCPQTDLKTPRTIRWTEAVDRPLPDGHFTCHRSVIGAVTRLKQLNGTGLMSNPYSPCVMPHEFESSPQRNHSVALRFWVRHFVTFQLSFAFFWLALALAMLGIAQVANEIFAKPHELFILPAIGTGVWVAHAILVLAYRKMRRVRASATAIVGSSIWVIGMGLGGVLPHYMSILPSEPILQLSLYTLLSIFAVWLFVRLQPDVIHKAAGNKPLDAKPSVGRFDLG